MAAEAIVRLRGELLAAGYAVELADVPEQGSVRAAMEPPRRPTTADAVVALFGDDPNGPGLLWVADRATGKSVSRAIPHDVDGTRAPQILAVRALELLRASFLEAALRPPAAAPPAARATAPSPAAPAPAPAAGRSESAPGSIVAAGPTRTEPPVAAAGEASDPERPVRAPSPAVGGHDRLAGAAPATGGAPPRLALEVGGFALGSFDGMPPAVLPLFRATFVPFASWPVGARLTVAGLGTRPRVDGFQGDAEIAHQLALAEVLWGFRRGRRWQPFLSVGAGASYVSAQGLAVAGGPAGRTAAAWAFAGDAAAGLHVGLTPRVQLGGELHVEVEAPSPAIRFLGSQLAAEGRPTLLASLSLLVWL